MLCMRLRYLAATLSEPHGTAFLQALAAYDEAALTPLMEKAAKMNLAKRHPELMTSANTVTELLNAESQIASTITSAIKSRDADALDAAVARGNAVSVAISFAMSGSHVVIVCAVLCHGRRAPVVRR